MSERDVMLETLSRRTGYSVHVLSSVVENIEMLGYQVTKKRTQADVQLPDFDRKDAGIRQFSLGEK